MRCRDGELVEQRECLRGEAIGTLHIAAGRRLAHGHKVVFDRSLRTTGGLQMAGRSHLIASHLRTRSGVACSWARPHCLRLCLGNGWGRRRSRRCRHWGQRVLSRRVQRGQVRLWCVL